MSYVSILKNIPEFLSQPAGIAAIASVGIHGAIAFILPLMPVDSESNTSKKESLASVGVMELSQAEQSRLPQKQGPQISALPKVSLQPGVALPKFATQPTPLPSLPAGSDSTKVILPPLPQSGANPNVSSLPKTASLPVLRQPNFNSSFNAKAKSAGSYRNYNPRMQLGKPTPLISRRSAPSRKSAPSRNIPPIQPRPVPAELTRIPTPPSLPPMGNPGISAGNSVAVNPLINPNVGNSAPVNQPKRIRTDEEFITPTNRNIPKAGDKLTFAGQNVRQWGSQPSGRRGVVLPNQPSGNVNTVPPVQNGNVTTPQSPAKLALARQLSEVEQRFENVEAKPPISEVIKTKPGKEGKVEGTIVVDSRGKVDYFKYVDRSVGSKLDKETRNYFRKYIKQNRDAIRKNGTAKVYAFALDFKSDAPKTVEFSNQSKPEDNKLVDRLRDTKDEPSQKKPENLSRSSTPIKIDAKPARGPVVVPTAESSAPVKIKQPVQIRTTKPSATSPGEIKLRNTQEVPKVPSKPKPQARVNVKEPAPQATSKPSLSSRLRNIKKDSESEDNKKNSDSKKLIQRLRQIQERRENSN